MKLTFTYSKQKDIWCLMNYGKSSTNSRSSTKVYEKLTAQYGENPSEENISDFIKNYIQECGIDTEKYIESYQYEWEQVANDFYRKAEDVFGIRLEKDIEVFLSINNRCPHSIPESYFFVSVPSQSVRATIMHELWHFYTWQKFGNQQETIGTQKYNELKEALTVLLNVECKELLGESIDVGYPQHQELRKRIVDIWEKEGGIEKLWNKITI
jgi:hypothetical protein